MKILFRVIEMNRYNVVDISKTEFSPEESMKSISDMSIDDFVKILISDVINNESTKYNNIFKYEYGGVE